MIIGVSSYSFSRLVKNGQMKQIDVIAKAKEMGFDAIEFSTLALPEGKSLPDFAAELRAEADKVGIPIVNYTIGADLLAGSGGDLQKEIDRVKGEVDVAEILGVPGMRHDCSGGRFPDNWQGAKSFDAALPRLAEGCRAISEYAAGKGIKTMIENHGYFCQDSIRVEKLVTAVAYPNFGLLIDMGNFICVDDDPAIAVGRLLPYAFHCHAKDFHLKPGTMPHPGRGWNQSRGGNWWRGAIIGHGNVPVHQCVRILAAKGYQGVLSIEFEGMEDVLTGIAIGQENLRRFVAMAQN
ncbi:sugar phosphate isomerase/epimerase family protein [Oligosphaera ethanolica]|jgi:sugar phosphate isomerase/epimerase|uniref:Sugar phosphate isomerase/epimerase n=1 Tax=Oligosphaera ethanolica TaxID=760260 RepID=A0AAE3VJG6_9BACT|nr:sugar phosphate isomerase/epimerase family protein [Oligosphaera ethanolica]MDQ0291259.1 sugar phosphate isomerase/epimerase [Oligosphaera ethanolica]NLE53545.1 sugar phosphate isomerase/epimerase [Lentisphaerota bacterium]